MPIRETLESCRAAARGAFCGPLCDPLCGPACGAGEKAGANRAEAAALYLAHAVAGAPIRRLAAATGRNPSTVLRAVRRVEARREDPLFDDLIAALEAAAPQSVSGPFAFRETALPHSTQTVAATAAEPAAADRRLEREARRILRRLGEPEAFMALARGAEVAVVFRKGADGLVTLARVALEDARAFLARDWISCLHRGPTMARYAMTPAGRAWLKRTLAADADARQKAAGFADAATPFARQHQEAGERLFAEPGGEPKKLRVNLGETPLGWLARRRGSDGTPFLTTSEVAAGERLREEFERAGMGPRVTQDWQGFLTPRGGGHGGGRSPAEGPEAARARLRTALDALGPGLDDAAMRACCFLEGLEATERRMGWSARSGKVVLKIALGRLAKHYGLDAPVPARATRKREPAAPPRLREAG